MAGDTSGVPAPKLRDENPSKTCVECEATLKVSIRYGRPVAGKAPSNPVKDGELEGPPDFVIEGVTVQIQGPTTASRKTDARGVATFEKVSVGKYKIVATYDQPKPAIISRAESKVGSTNWALLTDRSDSFGYGKGRNKCNLFVYNVTNEAGLTVTPYDRISISNLGRVDYPPLAGDWADPSKEINDWKVVQTPKVGDVVSAKLPGGWIAGASGHVAIVAGPEPNSAVKEYDLLVGVHTVMMRLPWTTIGAGEETVNRKEWPYDERNLGHYSTPVFRRHGG